jgi:hypothetical protein
MEEKLYFAQLYNKYKQAIEIQETIQNPNELVDLIEGVLKPLAVKVSNTFLFTEDSLTEDVKEKFNVISDKLNVIRESLWEFFGLMPDILTEEDFNFLAENCY